MKKNLKILNEGEEGYGILIEKDAGTTQGINKELSKVIVEGIIDPKDEPVHRIYIDCILQKANVQNRNGRIYPKHILEREIKNYQKLIDERNSFGECVDGETEIYTTNGWKYIKDISDNEEIYTLNIETNNIEPEIIEKKVVLDYSGIMYHIHDEHMDMLLTPNHNMLFFNGKKHLSMYAKEFVKDFIKHNGLTIKCLDEDYTTYHKIIHNYIKIEEIEYNGKVYCVKTNNRTWLMKRNGKTAWTHNCDHPDSPTISLKQDSLSHLVTKVWMKNDVVYGTIELITSKKYHLDGTISCIGDHIANLLERGYKLGISSRGLGSLKNVGGKNIVQDDFELVCWDLVSSPSTPDAYLYQKTTEINESYNQLQPKTDKLIKLNNFINLK